MRMSKRAQCKAWSVVLLGAMLALTGTTAIAVTKPMIEPSRLSVAERTELEAIIAEHVQMTLKVMTPAEGQQFPAQVTARFEDGRLHIELGRRFVLKADGTLNGAYVPDQTHMLTAVIGTVAPEVKYVGITYLFDGKDIAYYYPELRLRTKKTTSTQLDSPYSPFPPYIPPPVNGDPSRMYIPPQPNPSASYNPPSVAINPGHGLYKLYNAGRLDPGYRWTAQRDPSNGVLEDEATQLYAAELTQWFAGRSPGIDTFSTRSNSPQIHEQSTQESGGTHLWSDMGAKYHVEQLHAMRVRRALPASGAR